MSERERERERVRARERERERARERERERERERKRERERESESERVRNSAFSVWPEVFIYCWQGLATICMEYQGAADTCLHARLVKAVQRQIRLRTLLAQRHKGDERIRFVQENL